MTDNAREVFRRVNEELNRQESDTSQSRIIVRRENREHGFFRFERGEQGPQSQPVTVTTD